MTRETASLEFDRLSAADFFSKIAALTPEEAEAFQAAVRRHAEFEAKAAKGNMSSGDTAQMRHNIERLKAYRQKKKDDNFKIPDWMRNQSGAPPGSGGSPPGGRPSSGSRPNPGGGRSEPFPDDWDQKWKQREEDFNRRWDEEHPSRSAPAATGLDASGRGHALAALGGLGYMAFAPQTKDPNEAPSELGGRIGAHMQSTVPLGIGGHLVGRLVKEMGGHKYAPAIGALGGAALGALGGEAMYRVAAPFEAEGKAEDASAIPAAARSLRRDAKRTGASLGRSELVFSGLQHLPYAIVGGTKELPQLAASATSHALGKGLYNEYVNAHAMQHFNRNEAKKEKNAFSTNAFSGPMNPNIQSGASIIPPFKIPGLATPVEKKAEEEHKGIRGRHIGAATGMTLGLPLGALSGSILGQMAAPYLKVREGTGVIGGAALGGLAGMYMGGDAGRDLGQYLEKEKKAASAPTRGNFMMASDVPPLKVPSLRAPIEKNSDMMDTYYPYSPGDFKPAKLTGKTAGLSPMQSAVHAKSIGAPRLSAPPGPSIADIAKPKGPGMGSGIAGAFKGSIGGTAGVSEK